MGLQPPHHSGKHWTLRDWIGAGIALVILFLLILLYQKFPLVAALIGVVGFVISLLPGPVRSHITIGVHDLEILLVRCIQASPNIRQQLGSKNWQIATALSVILNLVLLLLFVIVPWSQATLPIIRAHFSPPPTIPRPIPSYIDVSQASDGELIGLSVGAANFDINRADGNLKAKAAQELKAKDPNTGRAEAYWTWAIQEDETDAEALIYRANQYVLDQPPGTSYITLVVFATLTGDDPYSIAVGRDVLQGAYVLQKEFNDNSKLPGGMQVRLIVANIGSQAMYADKVAGQVIQAIKTNEDTTIVGVIGQISDLNDAGKAAIQELNQANIPMISSIPLVTSPKAQKAPNLFNVAPSLDQEISVAAAHAHQVTNQVGIIYASNDPYGSSLEQKFKNSFTSDQVHEQQYTATTANDKDAIEFALEHIMDTPDIKLIYFAGYPDDAGVLLDLLRTNYPSRSVEVLGGDALYQFVHSSMSRNSFNTLRFTAFAFHDEWEWSNWQPSQSKPAFFDEYKYDFDSETQHVGNTYSYEYPDNDAVLAYDAAFALLQVSSEVLSTAPISEKQTLTPIALGKALKQIAHDQRPLKGVSGEVVFGDDNEPENKPVLLLDIEGAGIRMQAIQGCYKQNICSSF